MTRTDVLISDHSVKNCLAGLGSQQHQGFIYFQAMTFYNHFIDIICANFRKFDLFSQIILTFLGFGFVYESESLVHCLFILFNFLFFVYKKSFNSHHFSTVPTFLLSHIKVMREKEKKTPKNS